MILYKYLSPYRNFFDDRLLRFTPRSALNDPFEVRPTEASLRAHLRKKYPERDIEEWKGDYETLFNPILGAEVFHKYGILSLSKTNANILMWSHYSKDHTGYVLGLDMTHKFFQRTNKKTKQPGRVYKVSYARSRSRSVERMNDWYFHKSIDWKYEKEYRMILPLNQADKILLYNAEGELVEEVTDREEIRRRENLGHSQYMCLFEIPTDAIKSVIFGAKSDFGDLQIPIRDAIRQAGLEQNIDLYCARLDSDEYKLQIVPGLCYTAHN